MSQSALEEYLTNLAKRNLDVSAERYWAKYGTIVTDANGVKHMLDDPDKHEQESRQ